MSEDLHTLLRRQIKRSIGSVESIPAGWRALIDAVNEAYRQSDVDRVMLERSLELSSLELSDANAQLRQIVLDLQAAHGDMEARVRERTRDLEAAHARLRESQKMEAIGRLAGGIAHDFNNLLTAMLGYSELVLDHVAGDEELTSDVLEIKKACERASRLTRQLLAFSRRQVLQLQVLDLNELVVELQRMLSRVIGEDIRIEVAPDPALARTKADRGQVEQLLMNLVANGRDAMPQGGTLRIMTMNAELDAATAASHDGAPPGAYVTLTVTDTGVGMGPEILAHVFEPFFTTKPPGKGTGLGLATVYGIVRQSGGYIDVESTPGQGTRVTVFFPAVDAPADVPGAVEPARSLRGTETVLLVEDEASVRTVIRKQLAPYGYTILDAENGAEALAAASRYPARIDLLLTDVVMPGLSGPTLARQLVVERPEMRVLYVSGFSRESNLDAESLQRGESFLPKPFTALELAVAVRASLEKELPAVE